MGRLEDIGDADGWRCWLCDEVVDPTISSNDPRGASVDARVTKTKAKKQRKKGEVQPDRLAHIGCNTGKGAVDPVVPWPADLFVIDPVPIIAATDRLRRKGGREVMCRSLSSSEAEATADWLVDRVGRLHPDLELTSRVDEGGGQFLVSLVN